MKKRTFGPKFVKDWLNNKEYKMYVRLCEYLANNKDNAKDNAEDYFLREQYREDLMEVASVRSRSNGVPAKGLMLSFDNGFSIIATEDEIDEIEVLEYGTLIYKYKEDIIDEMMQIGARTGFYPSPNETVNIVIKHVSKKKCKEKEVKNLENLELSNNGINPFIEMEEE